MNYLSQRDKRWGSLTLGTKGTISEYGCTITCLAIILGTTPDVVNERIKAVNGYADGNLVIWAKLEEAFPGIKIKRVWSYDNADVLANVPNVLVEVDGKPIGGYRHWVVFIGNKKMIDPWDGLEKSTASYNSPLSYCVVLGKWNKPSPISDDQKVIEQLRMERDNNWNLYTSSQTENEVLKKQLQELNADYEGTKQELLSYKGIIRTYATLLNVPASETEKMSGEIKRLIETQDLYNKVSNQVDNLMEEVSLLQTDLSEAQKELSEAREGIVKAERSLNECRASNTTKELHEYSWSERFWSLFRR